MSLTGRVLEAIRALGTGPSGKEDWELQAYNQIDMDYKGKKRTLSLASPDGDPMDTAGYDKYFGGNETHLDHPKTGRLQRKAVASVNAYWGIYGVFRENFFQADNDRLARNPIYAVCEKAFMDYLGIVEWEVLDEREENVEKAEKFLKRPNPQDTFQTLLKMTGRDLVRYDAGAWVKTMSEPNSQGKQFCLELKAYSGPEFWMEIDRNWRQVQADDGLIFSGPYSLGYVSRYWQHARAGIFIPFEVNEVVYFRCYPKADGLYGSDFLSELKWYLEYMIDSTKAAGMTFRNGMMPGMKWKHPETKSIDQLIEDQEQLKAANLGPENFNGIVNLIGEEDIEPLTPTMVDMQWLEGQTYVAKIIWSMFGFSSDEFIGGDANRATAYVNRNITKSRMLAPILRKFEEMINTNILPDIEGYEPGWKFQFKDIIDLDDELKMVQIDQTRMSVVQGYMNLGIPIEAAVRVAGMDEEKIEQIMAAIQQAALNEPAYDQGIEGGAQPMGPPGPNGEMQTNPQGGQPLSPQEAQQHYAQAPGDQGPQEYKRGADYQGTANSQDHEGSDEDKDRVQKAERHYVKPGEKIPPGVKLEIGEHGGHFYMTRARGAGEEEITTVAHKIASVVRPNPQTPQGVQTEGRKLAPGEEPPEGRGETSGGDETPDEFGPRDEDFVTHKYAKKEPGKGRETEITNAEELTVILNRTKFALISSGVNDDEKKAGKSNDDEDIQARHEKMKAELQKKGYVFTQVLGNYGGYEDTFLVMAHNADRDDIVEMGSQYNQSSVIFSDHGNNEMITTRDYEAPDDRGYLKPHKKGEAKVGNGFDWIPPTNDAKYYTAIYLDDKNTTVNFQLHFDKKTDEDVKKPEPPKGPDQHISEQRLDALEKGLSQGGQKRADSALKQITKAVTKNGGEFEGLPQKLKTPDSIRKNLGEYRKLNPELSEDDLVKKLDDVVRFTSILSPERYLQGMTKTLEDLKKSGVKIVKVKNAWRTGGGCYRGVNVKLLVAGKPVELQFHTRQSYEIKEKKTHADYKIVNDTSKTKEERDEAMGRIKETYKKCVYPPGTESWHYV